MNTALSRRAMLGGAVGALMLSRRAVVADQAPAGHRICAFIKFVQSLKYDELAAQIAAMGYGGIEATIRPGGLIEPAQAPEELPKLVDALARHQLEITVMTTSITRADDLVQQKLLQTAAKLGVRRYRMGYYRYDLKKPIVAQLDQFRPQLQELAALNRELGITAAYQNHSAPTNVGATIWDLQRLLQGIPSQEIGVAFDIRHATAEAGLSWPLLFRVAQPHLQAVFVKDFIWEGRRAENVPLGQGQVDPAFFRLLRDAQFDGPISVHVEYLEKAGVEENLAALRTDLTTLRGWLKSAK